MSTVALDTSLGLLPQEPRTRTDSCLKSNGNETHNGADEMHDDDIRDVIAREVRYALREQGGGMNAGRSVDTLRRDIGIFAILLGMMVQTGAAFYWAGGVSRTQDSNKETMVQVQAEQSYTRAQLQNITSQLATIQGKQQADIDKHK